ncbi:GH14557 [Drosophila grimshawi]|uniref:GH14557 n=2 Tax=Drosophila grimshawi TaxID=7222 RepID=B4IYY3_DROGR|nr:GH14557 [Drosophila grimshawi]
MPSVSPFQAIYHEPFMWPALTLPRQWQQLERQQEQYLAQAASIGKQGYQVSMDVSEFKPNELTVKLVNNSVIVEGKSEQQEDDQGSYTSRHFLRRFALPEGYEPDMTTSSLSSDGVLTINVPNPPAVDEALKERLVPIQQTGPAELNVKPNLPLDAAAEEQKETAIKPDKD